MGLVEEFQRIIYDLTHWEQKYPGGEGIYHLFEIDLSEAREDKMYPFDGDRLIITDCEAQADLRLNNKRNDLIDLNVVRNIGSRFKRFYLTNSASAGKNLKILAGAGGIFRCDQPQLVDITRCNYGNLPTDIIIQSVNRLIIRDSDGGVEASGLTSQVCNANSETTIHSYSGSGSFRYALMVTTQGSWDQLMALRIYIDGTMLRPNYSCSNLNAYGFDSNSRPIQLLTYGIDDFCTVLWYFEKGIVFDTSLVIKAYNHSIPQDIQCDFSWFYQKLT